MVQRVTNGMMINTFLRNLNTNTTRMERYESQMATGRKIARLSDDPVGVIKGIAAHSKLNDIEQFNRNVSDARAWMTASETALQEINTVVKRAYELSVQAANETLGQDDLKAIKDEIGQLRDHLVQIGNTTLGDKFIFGGFNVSRAPFEVVGDDPMFQMMANASGDVKINLAEADLSDPDVAETIERLNTPANYEIGFSIYMDIGIGPVDLMGAGEKNLYKIFNDFFNALGGLDEEGDEFGVEVGNVELQPFLAKFQEAQRGALAIIADVGGRQNRLDLIEERYEQDMINYTQMVSDVEDLDQAEAIMNFSMAEAVYRAALSTGARIIQPTLVDFLQ